MSLEDAHMYFATPMSSRFGPPSGRGQDEHTRFLADLCGELSPYTRHQLESAVKDITRSRKAQSFPSMAECIEACERHLPQPLKDLPKVDRDHDAEWRERREARRKAVAMCRSEMGREARKAGWLNALLDFATEHGRLPQATEISRCQRLARQADEASIQPGLREILEPWRKAMHERAEKEVFGMEAGR